MTDTETIPQEAMVALVDSSAILALANRHDRTHQQAVAAYNELLDRGYKLFTTNYIISETFLLLELAFGPDIARSWLQSHRLPVYHADEQDEKRAVARIVNARPGSHLTMTDAVSSVVMDRLGVSDAFAVDPGVLSDSD